MYRKIIRNYKENIFFVKLIVT